LAFITTSYIFRALDNLCEKLVSLSLLVFSSPILSIFLFFIFLFVVFYYFLFILFCAHSYFVLFVLRALCVVNFAFYIWLFNRWCDS